LTGLKEAADQGRMFGNLHTIERAKFWPETMICIKAYQLQERRMALRQLCSEGVCYRHPDGPCGEAKPSTGGKCRQREKARRLWGGKVVPAPPSANSLHKGSGYSPALVKVRNPTMSRGCGQNGSGKKFLVAALQRLQR
jgi:hypothetical protein